MELDGGVKPGKATEKLGLRQVEDFPFPLIFEKGPTQEQRKWNGKQFRHRKAVVSG
jgi:hypothetical protein